MWWVRWWKRGERSARGSKRVRATRWLLRLDKRHPELSAEHVRYLPRNRNKQGQGQLAFPIDIYLNLAANLVNKNVTARDVVYAITQISHNEGYHNLELSIGECHSSHRGVEVASSPSLPLFRTCVRSS